MGGVGSDIAVDAADIALVNDEIKELPHLLALSKRMMITIKCNLTFSMGLNFLAIILAVTGILNPVVGALVHNAGSVLIIINSALLLKWRKNKKLNRLIAWNRKVVYTFRQGGVNMANEDKKDFNAMLNDSKDMPKIQIITDEKSIKKYGGNRMYFAPPIDYDLVMKRVPQGKLITVGKIREYFANLSGADFTEPITAGIFVAIAAWASHQRTEDKTPYWRTLKANGELNPKYPGGIEAQKEKLESEGHIIIQKGRTNIRYYVKDYESSLLDLS